jgi:hypothetical protein
VDEIFDLYFERDVHGGARDVWLRLTEAGILILEGQDLGGAVPGGVSRSPRPSRPGSMN